MANKELDFFLRINDLQKTKRYAKYPAFIESTAEHSFKLVLIIDYLYKSLALDLDYQKCISLGIYHDFSEIDMPVDIDAYEGSKAKTAKHKELLEHEKIERLAEKYDENIKLLFNEYSEKITAEALFVNACDKLEACIHVLSVNEKIMNHEFFATYADKAIIAFPKLMPIYKEIKILMQKKYLHLGYDWKKEYDIIFIR